MLTLEPPIYVLRGVTVFRDGDDPDQFYCLPPAPRLAAQGDGLAFKLYKYRRDLTDNPALDPTRAKGAGLALFEVEAPVLPSIGALQTDVATESGRENARLSPVLFRSGTVQAIVAHGDGDQFVEDLVSSRAAPLAYPHHAAFALALSAEGATLFEAAARGGQLPVGVDYELGFLAQTPSLHAHVHMHYDRMYDHFATSLGFTYYVSAKIDVELAWLVEHDLVKIEIVAFSDDADKDRQQQLVMDLVRARVTNDFFQTAVPADPDQSTPGPLGQMLQGLVGGKKVTSATALFVLKASFEHVSEQKELDLVFDGRTAVELTHVCTGTLATLLADGPPPSILEIDLDDPFFSSLDVEVLSTIDFDQLTDLRSAVVTLAYHDHRDSYELTPTASGPYRFQAALASPQDDEYSYDVEYHFDADAGGGPTTIAAGPFSTRDRVLVVDPLQHFRYLRVDVLLGPVDPAQVPRIAVRMRIPGDDGQPDLARDEVDLDAQHQKVTWRQRLPLGTAPLRVLARADWQDPHGVTHQGDEHEVTGRSFVALGPFRDLLDLTVVPAADWTRTTEVAVDLRYVDGDYRVDRSLTFVPQDGTPPASQRVPIALMDPSKRAFSWRQLLIHADGTTAQGDWADFDGSFLVVGREPPPPGQVRVVWVGAADGVLGLRVDFFVASASGPDENVATFLRSTGDSTVLLPLDPTGHLQYRYEVRRVTTAGEDLVRSGEGSSNLLVVQATG